MIAIISDVHGNFVALKEVLKTIDAMKITEIYCLGDIVGYYSQVNECCDELRRRKASCVLGNHDWYMTSGENCPRSKSANDCMTYQRKVITVQNLNWLKTFPHILESNNISMVHGSWENHIDEYLVPTKEYFSNLEGQYFCSGHTHIPILEMYDDKIYCNPGSVGQPRDGDNRASFATFDGESFKHHRVEYDIKIVGELMENVGFSGYYYGCLDTGAKNLCWGKQERNANV